MKLGDYLTAINYSKENLLDSDDTTIEKDYTPFVINRCLSYFPDTILQVNEMNIRPSIDKKMQFDFLLGSIRKRKRFSKWIKDENVEDFEMIRDYFEYSNRKTKEIMHLLTEEDIENIRKEVCTGGQK
jgi:hypothetical protein